MSRTPIWLALATWLCCCFSSARGEGWTRATHPTRSAPSEERTVSASSTDEDEEAELAARLRRLRAQRKRNEARESRDGEFPVRRVAWHEHRASAEMEDVPAGKPLDPVPDSKYSSQRPSNGGEVWEEGMEGDAGFLPSEGEFTDEGFGGSCGFCGGDGDGCCGPGLLGRLGYPCNSPPCCACTPYGRFWVRAEYLMWWTRGMDSPPLITTSTTGTSAASAGVLQQANTSILFGGSDLLTDMRSGGRLTFGTWLDCGKHWGVEGDYAALGTISQHYSATASGATGSQILARPFFNVLTGQEDAELISYPSLIRGTGTVDALGRFQTAGARLTKNLVCESMQWHDGRGGSCGGCGDCDDCGDCDPGCHGWHRVDLIGGYRFARIDERITIGEDLTSLTSDNLTPAGTRFVISDRFSTRNEFHGGELGLASHWRRCAWTVDLAGRCALGNVRNILDIAGDTTTTVNGTPTTQQGGLLALSSNIGHYTRDHFAVMPQVELTVGRYITPRLRAVVGYSFLYLNHVIRPSEQIDVGVNTNLIPPATQTGVSRPAFAFQDGEFWAQGMSFGLDYHF